MSSFRVQYPLAVCLALIATGYMTCSARAGDPAEKPACTPTICSQPCAPENVWLVSTRRLGGCCPPGEVDGIEFEQYQGCSGWSDSNREAFIDTGGDGAVTCFFAHGNRTDVADARREALAIYRELAFTRSLGSRFRVVGWSWPSERATRGPVRDARLKSYRTDAEGYYLAWIIDQLHEREQVSLIGYSLGARIDTGAAHLLGGGSLAGHALARTKTARPPLRMALWAAAINCDWLWPGHRHGQALSVTDRLLLVNNSCDRVLRRYPKLECRRGGTDALGYVGLGRNGLDDSDWSKVSQFDACCLMGPRHDIDRYIYNEHIMSLVRGAVTFSDN